MKTVTLDPADIDALEGAAEALIRLQGLSDASLRLLALALRFRAESGIRAEVSNVVPLRSRDGS